jgi:hypothetical protein
MFEKLNKRLRQLNEDIDAEEMLDDIDPDSEQVEDVIVEPSKQKVCDDVPTDTDDREDVEEDWSADELSSLTSKNKQDYYYAKTSMKGNKTAMTTTNKTLDEMFQSLFEDEIDDVPEKVNYDKGDKEPVNDYDFADDADSELTEEDEEPLVTVDSSDEISDEMEEALRLFEADEDDSEDEDEDDSDKKEVSESWWLEDDEVEINVDNADDDDDDVEDLEEDEEVEINVDNADDDDVEVVDEDDDETLDAVDDDLEDEE